MARSDNGNLRRGNRDPKDLIPQPHGGALLPAGIAGDGDRLRAGIQAIEDVKAAVADDPDAALEEIHKSLTVWTRKLVLRGARENKAPDAATMNVIREFRQTTEAVTEARKSRGDAVELQAFFAGLDERLGDILPLAPEPVPMAEP
jgi:hypothetical protein